MNMPFPVLKTVQFGKMELVICRKEDRVAYTLIPAGSGDRIPVHRTGLAGTPAFRHIAATAGWDEPACTFPSAAEFHVVGDAYPGGYTAGDDLRGVSGKDMTFDRMEETSGKLVLLLHDAARQFREKLVFEYTEGASYLKIHTEFCNEGAAPVTLDMLEAVTLSMLSPFHPDDQPEALKLHRYRSHWSAEGRHDVQYLEDLALEPSWTHGCPRTLRFGQRSTLPVKGFFPFAGLEDVPNGICWGLAPAVTGPWQIQVTRQDDFAVLSCGYPDGESAGWRHTVDPGETCVSPTALVSCRQGSMQEVLQDLADYSVRENTGIPAEDAELPCIFNEYCGTWGKPTEENLKPMLERLKGLPVRYFVMDAGWFRSMDKSAPYRGIGDWNVFEENYPSGFGQWIRSIREAGFVPGIWFEFENVSMDSRLYKEHPEWFVTADGRIYRHGCDRYFLDFRKPEVRAYLDEKVIGFLKKYGIGYMKVDYNATLHLADTAAGSPADGVLAVNQAAAAYFRHVREELPELVLEVCASGGYRLTPEWMRIGTMASFSDAHETLSIPIIAARTALLIPFRHNQVWATLREDDTPELASFRLAAGFLGRLCISGNVDKVSADEFAMMRHALEVYQQSADILKDGTSVLEEDHIGRSWNSPRGYQVFRRTAGQGEVIVLHTFAGSVRELEIPVDPKREIIDSLLPPGVIVTRQGDRIRLAGLADFAGIVLVMR